MTKLIKKKFLRINTKIINNIKNIIKNNKNKKLKNNNSKSMNKIKWINKFLINNHIIINN